MCRLLIFFIYVLAPFSLHPFELLESYSASYRLSAKNIEIGLIEQKFSIEDDGNYQFASTLATVGIGKLISSLSRTQISTGKFIDGQFIPTHYSHHAQRDKRSYVLDFDHINTVATDIEVRSRSTPKLFDELSYQSQLRADLLNNINDYEYLVQKKHKQKLYTFRHEKKELIATKLGTFMGKKMVRKTNNPGKSIKIWFAENLNYIPVKIELLSKKTITIAILTKFSHSD